MRTTTLKEDFKVINDIYNPRNEEGKRIKSDKVFLEGCELDILCHKFINKLGLITQKKGFDCIVEGKEMDLWKSKIWRIVEDSGLLKK